MNIRSGCCKASGVVFCLRLLLFYLYYVIFLTDLHAFVRAKSRLPLDKGRRFWYYNTDRKRLGTEGVPHDGGIESLWSVQTGAPSAGR